MRSVSEKIFAMNRVATPFLALGSVDVLIEMLLLGCCAVASEQETNAKVLVIGVYSIKASGVVEEKGFALWARNLKEGRPL
jgi:hypothetical protein